MKPQLFAQIITASAIAISTIATINQSSSAQTNTYFCEKGSRGVPTTFARNATGKRIEVIRWQRDWGGGITREARCREVSARFQRASKDQALSYLTTGIMSGQKVVCATSQYGGPCSHLLLTLRPDDNPNDVITALFGVAYRAQGGPVIQSGDGSSQIYINMNLLLNQETRTK